VEAFFKEHHAIVLYKPVTLGKLAGTLQILEKRLEPKG
jgi:hypothetical protein